MEINQEKIEEYLEQKQKVSVEDLRDYFGVEIYEEKQELDAIVFDLETANFLTIEHPRDQREKDEILQPDTILIYAGK